MNCRLCNRQFTPYIELDPETWERMAIGVVIKRERTLSTIQASEVMGYTAGEIRWFHRDCLVKMGGTIAMLVAL